MIIVSISENLKRIRRDKNWTQGQLADDCGIRLGQISKIERNETDPKLSTLYALMNSLECTPNALLSDTDKTNLDGLLTIALERMQKLPERDKNILLEIIDKYCIAKSMQDIVENDHDTILGFRSFAGRTKELAKKDMP